MRKIICAFLTLSPFLSDAQSDDAKIVTDKFKDSKPLNIYVQAYVENPMYNIYFWGASFYWPGKMYVSLDFDITPTDGSVSSSAVYFLSSWEKSGKRTFILRKDQTEYRLKYTLPIQHHFGPHAGMIYPMIFGKSTLQTYRDPVNCPTLVLGVGYIRGRYLDVIMAKDVPNLKKTKQVGLFMDFVYYFFPEEVHLNSYSPTSKAGMKMYIRGKNSFQGSIDWGYNYDLGIGTYGSDVINPSWGLGLYVGIG